ncbi:hypothetical protein [Bradyrhizobium sp. BR 10289]|uniref:hypothetical protein n=1 Tax=Bradyrhizobium sp. BR 10289 TaxID=2749993 RepID=UPI001C64F5CC|nr:hypothetical protein [Bradyrhizobium sp. BR 10289]MBW7970289.1 hypothetical protein [Bradyrhizobium sp. BR 10289]
MGKSRPWTDEETEQLRTLARDGLTLTQVAAALNRTDTTVRKKADEFGIEVQRRIPDRRDDVPNYPERAAIIALSHAAPLPVGVGKGTLASLLRKGWIAEQGVDYKATAEGVAAVRRKIPTVRGG